MNAEEIRKMLKPMADFAPAILRCAEIVEAAEAAEVRLVTVERQIADKELYLANLKIEQERFERLASEAQQRYAKAREDSENKIAEINAKVAEARVNYDKAMVALNLAEQKKRDEVTALNIEIANAQKKLEQSKQSLREWAEKNSLKVA